MELLHQGRLGQAFLNVLLANVLGLAGVWIGFRFGQSLS